MIPFSGKGMYSGVFPWGGGGGGPMIWQLVSSDSDVSHIRGYPNPIGNFNTAFLWKEKKVVSETQIPPTLLSIFFRVGMAPRHFTTPNKILWRCPWMYWPLTYWPLGSWVRHLWWVWTPSPAASACLSAGGHRACWPGHVGLWTAVPSGKKRRKYCGDYHCYHEHYFVIYALWSSWAEW